jgi:hypothetical protein
VSRASKFAPCAEILALLVGSLPKFLARGLLLESNISYMCSWYSPLRFAEGEKACSGETLRGLYTYEESLRTNRAPLGDLLLLFLLFN